MNNYYQKYLQTIDYIKKNYDKKPTLLFHVCCGPCSFYPLLNLIDIFDITIYYDNSNIYPKEEFDRRLDNLKKIIKLVKQEKNIDIKLITPEYNYDEYIKELQPFSNEKEGGHRCHLCYKKRMFSSYKFADENHFDFFTTSLTSSRQKSSEVINTIGEELQNDFHNTKYLFSDFKKKAWAEMGYAKAKNNNIYLQLYCGCEFSLKNSK